MSLKVSQVLFQFFKVFNIFCLLQFDACYYYKCFDSIAYSSDLYKKATVANSSV